MRTRQNEIHIDDHSHRNPSRQKLRNHSIKITQKQKSNNPSQKKSQLSHTRADSSDKIFLNKCFEHVYLQNIVLNEQFKRKKKQHEYLNEEYERVRRLNETNHNTIYNTYNNTNKNKNRNRISLFQRTQSNNYISKQSLSSIISVEQSSLMSEKFIPVQNCYEYQGQQQQEDSCSSNQRTQKRKASPKNATQFLQNLKNTLQELDIKKIRQKI